MQWVEVLMYYEGDYQIMKSKKDTSKHEIIRDSKGKFVKGHSGNPSGRPKDDLVTTARRILDEMKAETNTTLREEFVRKTIIDGMNGDPVARKIIWQYLQALPKQKLDVTSEDEKIGGFIIVKDEVSGD